jgi:hypothetical protein
MANFKDNYIYNIISNHPGIISLYNLDWQECEERVLERATAVIVHSVTSAEQLRGRFPALPAKIWVIAHKAVAENSGAEIREDQSWPEVAGEYAEIIERTGGGRSSQQPHAISALPEMAVTGSAEWLQPQDS